MQILQFQVYISFLHYFNNSLPNLHLLTTLFHRMLNIYSVYAQCMLIVCLCRRHRDDRLHICLQERKIKDIEVLRHARFVHRLGNSHYPTLDQPAKCHLCSRLTVLRRLLLFHYHTPERYQSSCNRPQAHPAHIIPLRVVELERLCDPKSSSLRRCSV